MEEEVIRAKSEGTKNSGAQKCNAPCMEFNKVTKGENKKLLKSSVHDYCMLRKCGMGRRVHKKIGLASLRIRIFAGDFFVKERAF
jgi:hypothetical protein